jgi:hypothetical protein
MSKRKIFHDGVIVSYSQVMIYDKSVQLPGCDWTETHSNQGFARREGTFCCGTLIDCGKANITVYLGAIDALDKYERVIETPFKAHTGKIGVEGPDEYPIERGFQIEPGIYNLTVAQKFVDEGMVKVDVYFQWIDKPLTKSAILLQDDDLNPPDILLEDAEIPGIQ